MLIALFIGQQAVGLAYRSVQSLLDRELDDETRQKISALANSDPQVRGIQDLRTRESRKTMLIQFHLELDGALSLEQAHSIAVETSMRIRQEFTDAEVIIHQDPV